ncbi:hypothetical protein [Paenibacillus sp. 1-18]|uniref:hypothetical protein n=1 Tax=Paenibacillus sp. 1-18 TaxID=1333846 RepID=UPI0012DE7100|nr:hypothetical protein [Paenibacillus sp. 1-18]
MIHVLMLLSITVSKNHTALIISTAMTYGKRRFCHAASDQKAKKSACCIEQNGFLQNHNYFFRALFHLYLAGVKKIKALGTRAHSSSMPNHGPLPKKSAMIGFVPPDLSWRIYLVRFC